MTMKKKGHFRKLYSANLPVPLTESSQAVSISEEVHLSRVSTLSRQLRYKPNSKGGEMDRNCGPKFPGTKNHEASGAAMPFFLAGKPVFIDHPLWGCWGKALGRVKTHAGT